MPSSKGIWQHSQNNLNLYDFFALLEEIQF
jgi:hypothetical protein